ncbi:unnamed protein product, partial [Meganyctiphanes norvegica]
MSYKSMRQGALHLKWIESRDIFLTKSLSRLRNLAPHCWSQNSCSLYDSITTLTGCNSLTTLLTTSSLTYPAHSASIMVAMGMVADSQKAKRNIMERRDTLESVNMVHCRITMDTLSIVYLRQNSYEAVNIQQEFLNNSYVSTLIGDYWASKRYLVVSGRQGLCIFLNRTKLKKIKNISLIQSHTEEFSISPNLRYVLLLHHIIKGRLFTRTAKYSIYDVETDHYYPLKLWRKEVGHPRYQHVAWLGDEGAKLVVVSGGNVFYVRDLTQSPTVLTTDARPEKVFNGVPDLLYEEILKQPHAVWPSPNGELLTVATFNDSNVRELPILEYSDHMYPTLHALRYPTVDTDIPEVTLWVYNLSTSHVPPPRVRLIPPKPITDVNYMVATGWVNSTVVWVSWASRDQSSAVLATCHYPKWQCTLVHVNHASVGVSPVVRSVVWAGKWAVFPWVVRTATGSWHNHVALVGTREGRHAPLTLEEYHVKDVLGCKQPDGLVYFLGTELEKGASLVQVYSVSPTSVHVKCITCHLGCASVSASLNPGLTHAVVVCGGNVGGLPTTMVISLEDPLDITILHNQTRLKNALVTLALPELHSLDVELAPAIHASVTLTMPPGWTITDETLLYPLIVQMVGPGEFDIYDHAWHIGWKEFLASGHQVAHARIQLWGSDPSARASVHTLATYQAKVIQKLMEQFDFLDPANVAVWGWGTGGSLALDAAAMAHDMFKCVAVVNPVVDWRSHGSFWAERLLGRENSLGAGRRYEDSDLMRLGEKLQNDRIMLVQGTQDPAAHHSFLLALALTEHGKHFKHVVYPDEDYMLDRVRVHLLDAFDKFFFSCMHDPLIYSASNR